MVKLESSKKYQYLQAQILDAILMHSFSRQSHKKS